MSLSSTHWAVIFGAAAGGIIGLVAIENRQVNELLAKLGTQAETLRLPDPSYAVYLPQTQDDFVRLDALACECLAVPSDGADPIAAAVTCMATKLYPDFPWPPMSGDHPTASELWQDLNLIATRQAALGACPA